MTANPMKRLAFVRGCKLDKDKLKQLARYCVNEGTDYTENGKWDISYDELYYHFGVEVSATNQNGKLLAEELVEAGRNQ